MNKSTHRRTAQLLALGRTLDCIVVNMPQRWQFRRGSVDPDKSGFLWGGLSCYALRQLGCCFIQTAPDLPAW